MITGLIRDVKMIEGKSVLDVGCGVGLASLTAAALNVVNYVIVSYVVVVVVVIIIILITLFLFF